MLSIVQLKTKWNKERDSYNPSLTVKGQKCPSMR